MRENTLSHATRDGLTACVCLFFSFCVLCVFRFVLCFEANHRAWRGQIFFKSNFSGPSLIAILTQASKQNACVLILRFWIGMEFWKFGFEIGNLALKFRKNVVNIALKFCGLKSNFGSQRWLQIAKILRKHSFI